MYILTLEDKKDEGAFSVTDDDGVRSLYFFIDEDDAVRFAGLLEAEDDPNWVVVEVEDEAAIKTCEMYNYQYVIISPDDFVIPPKEDAPNKEDKI